MRDDLDTLRWLRVALRGTPLVDQIAACGEIRRSANNTYRNRCGQPACLWCHRRYVHWRGRRLAEQFADTPSERLVWFSLFGRRSEDITGVLATYGSLRQAIRNAAREPRLRAIRAYGGLRPDPLPARLLGATYAGLPPEQPVWQPTLHGFAELPVGITYHQFQDRLANSPRLQVRVRAGPFDAAVEQAVQIAAHVRRAFVTYASTELATEPEGMYAWPLDWAAAYFSGLHAVGGGFRTMTFQRGMRGPAEPTGPQVELTEIEPLPVIVDQQPWMNGWW